jgi:hypothetical protein
LQRWRFIFESSTLPKDQSIEENSYLFQLAIEDALDLNLLGSLGSQVSIKWLQALKGAGDLAGLGVALGDAEGDVVAQAGGILLILLGELLLIASSASRQGVGDVVPSGPTPVLGVQERGSSVRRHQE